MVKLVSPKLEQKLLRTICDSKKYGSYVLASIDSDYFYYGPCQKAYNRITKILQKKNYIVSWDELLEDPVLEQRDREILSEVKKPKIKDKSKIESYIKKLAEYRKLRDVTFMADSIIKQVRSDKVDIDNLLEEATESLLKAKSSSSIDEAFTHIGKNGNADEKIKKLLKGESFNCIPTGFKQFDKVNRGLIEQGLIVVAGTTGGGKSALSQQMMLNMSKWGAKCCYVPLEMSDDEMLQRMLANLANVEMGDFLRADDFSNKKQVKIYKKYLKYQKKLQRKNVTSSIFVPPEDMSIEEILFLLKPMKYKVIFIDYIGLLKGVGGDDQWQKLGAAARFAKIFAKNNKCCVVLCAQLSDEGAIKYSKAVEEHANTSFYWVYDETAKQTGIVEVTMKKARNQKPIIFYLKMDFAHMKVKDISAEEREMFMEQEKNDSKVKGKNDVDKELFDL